MKSDIANKKAALIEWFGKCLDEHIRQHEFNMIEEHPTSDQIPSEVKLRINFRINDRYSIQSDPSLKWDDVRHRTDAEWEDRFTAKVVAPVSDEVVERVKSATDRINEHLGFDNNKTDKVAELNAFVSKCVETNLQALSDCTSLDALESAEFSIKTKTVGGFVSSLEPSYKWFPTVQPNIPAVDLEEPTVTIIKVDGASFSSENVDKVRALVERGIDPESIPFVSVEKMPLKDGNLTVVRMGSDDWRPSPEDVANMRDLLIKAQNDSDFKIFTNHEVQIDNLKLGSNILVIAGKYASI